MTEEKCVICDATLHSITSRRIGAYQLCMEHGDKLAPVINSVVNSFVESVANAVNVGHITFDHATRLAARHKHVPQEIIDEALK